MMKKNKALLIALLVALVVIVVSVSACDESGAHVHIYDNWTITEQPTETAGGSATRTCICGNKETAELPKLTDTATWTVTTAEATHAADGLKTYSSQYGTVTVVLQKLAHEYGEWTLTANPTATEKGAAERVCSCGQKETADVAVLTDTTVWTAVTTAATHAAAGKTVYTSDYGTVEIAIPAEAHAFGSWTLLTKPTDTVKGSAERVCSCGQKETAEVAVLTDTTVWTAVTTAATHAAAGKTVYTSDYGTVEIAIPAEAHAFGSWTLLTKPTDTVKGSAERVCTCGQKETAEVAALSDTAVWTVVTTAPSHTAAGKTVYTSDYGTVEIAIPVEAHAFGNWTIATKPTQVDEGLAKRTCSCGAEDTAVLAVLTDDAVWSLTNVDSTCTLAGSNTFTSAYGTVVLVIPVKEHIYGDWTITTDSTDITEGSAKRVCSVCSNEDTADLAILTDTTVWTADITLAATCTAEGEKTYTSDYGTIVVSVTVLPHTYGSWALTADPTYTEKGNAERSCTVCSAKDTAQVDNLNSDIWTSEITTSATCTANGEKTYSSVYGNVVVEITAPGHNYGDWIIKVNPTESETGSAERICSVCNDKDTDVLPNLLTDTVWSVDETKSNATHDVAGTLVYVSVYGEVELANVTVGAHTYGSWSWTTEPTMEAGGVASRTCSACDDTQTQNVPALSDSFWNVSTTNASCTVNGSTTYTCTYGKVVFPIIANGHTYGSWTITTKPTAEATGTATRYCSVCNTPDTDVLAVYTDSTVWACEHTKTASCTATGTDTYTNATYGSFTVELPTISHNWASSLYSGDSEAHYYKCAFCDAKKDEAAHSFGTCTPISAATCTEAGSESCTCSICGYVKTNSLAALGHDVDVDVYEISTNPTMDATGSAGNRCARCNQLLNLTSVPALSNTTVWSVKTSTAPDYATAGSTVYTSVYGDVTVESAKLVAIYDNKTYGAYWLNASDEEDQNSVVSAYARNMESCMVSIGADSTGIADGSPFRGKTSICFVNELNEVIGTVSNRVKIVTIAPVIDENDNVTYTGSVTTYYGYIDAATGLIVIVNSYCNVDIYTPFETSAAMKNSNVKASTWDYGMAIQYTAGDTTYSIFVTATNVYFGASFKDVNDQAIAAESCFNAPFLYAYASNGDLIEGFVFNGVKLVVSDGYEGTYTGTYGSISFSGYGALTAGENNGTYTKADGAYTLDAYFGGAYYELTLDTVAKTYTGNKPMVTISYVLNNEDATAIGGEFTSVNKNIEFTLPVPANTTTKAFIGWFTDDVLANAAGTAVTPTQNSTFYAKWANLIAVNVVDEIGGNKTLYYGEGEALSTKLPVYTANQMSGNKAFKGWYTVVEAENLVVDTDAELSTDDSGITITAKWVELPAYVGTYYGVNTYGDTRSYNSSAATISIAEDGTVSGKWDGKVTNYDANTQIITWISGSTTYYFWYEPTLGILSCGYSKTTTTTLNTNDNWTFVKNQNSFPVEQTIAINDKKIRFVTVNTPDGFKIIMMYNNKLSGAVTTEKSDGTQLAISEIRNSSSLVVKNSEGNILLNAVSSLANFGASNSKAILIDEFIGTYTNADESIVIDGTGNITYGEKTGTYTKAVAEALHTIDVYFTENTEYYQITLNGASFTASKPMATISYVTGEGHNPVIDSEFNINIAATLPVLNEDGYVFNGWFLDELFANPVADPYIPTENDTLYAKFSAPAVLTVHYNDGITANTQETYSAGDIVTVEKPVYAKHRFVNWYTTSDFQEATVWTSGSAISANLDIYAKWEDAPAYSNTYIPTAINGTNTNGGVATYDCRTYGKITIDPYGAAPSSSWPFSAGAITAAYTDEAAGIMSITCGSSTYRAVIDKTTGTIVMNYSNGLASDIDRVWILSCLDTADNTSKFASSYWNGGKTRAITYTFESDSVYNIFVMNNVVYFGATFKDAAGNAIAANECYNAATLYVEDSLGALITKCGYNGTTMVDLDGNEGTYTNGEGNTLTLNGISGITITDTTIALADKTGTYSALDVANTFGVHITVESVDNYYEIVIDTDAKTYTVSKPMVTLTFVTDKSSSAPMSVNKNTEITLPVISYDGFVFKGWKIGEDSTVYTTYTPAESIEFTAVWNANVIVTLVKGNGEENEELTVEVSTVPRIDSPVWADHIFMGWYVGENKYENTAVTEAMTLTARWIDKPAFVGGYKGTEVWGEGATGSGGSAKELTINENFSFTGAKSGDINVDTFSAASPVFTFDGSGYLMSYYKFGTDEFVLINYSNSTTDAIAVDVCILVKTDVAVSFIKQVTWNSGKQRLVSMTFGEKTILVFVDAENDEFYGNVSIRKLDGSAFTIGDVYSSSSYASSLVIYNYENVKVREYANKNNAFVALDGNQGTYSGTLGDIVIDGGGNLTVNGGEACEYTLSNSVVYFVNDAKQCAITLSESTYTIVADGFAGTYTGPNGDLVLAGDGSCTLNSVVAVYYVKGAEVIVTIGGVATNYGLDTVAFTYSAKSLFAGLTFTGTYYDEWDECDNDLSIVFDDSSLISGIIKCGNYSAHTWTFNATFEGGVLSMNITAANYGNTSGIGKIQTATLSGKTFTFTNQVIANGQLYTVKDGTCTCATFGD